MTLKRVLIAAIAIAPLSVAADSFCSGNCLEDKPYTCCGTDYKTACCDAECCVDEKPAAPEPVEKPKFTNEEAFEVVFETIDDNAVWDEMKDDNKIQEFNLFNQMNPRSRNGEHAEALQDLLIPFKKEDGVKARKEAIENLFELLRKGDNHIVRKQRFMNLFTKKHSAKGEDTDKRYMAIMERVHQVVAVMNGERAEVDGLTDKETENVINFLVKEQAEQKEEAEEKAKEEAEEKAKAAQEKEDAEKAEEAEKLAAAKKLADAKKVADEAQAKKDAEAAKKIAAEHQKPTEQHTEEHHEEEQRKKDQHAEGAQNHCNVHEHNKGNTRGSRNKHKGNAHGGN